MVKLCRAESSFPYTKKVSLEKPAPILYVAFISLVFVVLESFKTWMIRREQHTATSSHPCTVHQVPVM